LKILVAGATGTVGQHVVKQGLSRGHAITAVARHPERLKTTDQNLTKVAADILDPAAIEPQLNGIDAVISTVGVGASKAQPPCTRKERRACSAACRSTVLNASWSSHRR